MLYIDCKLVSVMFDKWKSTADEITGLDGLRIQAHCLIAYFHSSLVATHSSHVTLWVSVIILWLALMMHL